MIMKTTHPKQILKKTASFYEEIQVHVFWNEGQRPSLKGDNNQKLKIHRECKIVIISISTISSWKIYTNERIILKLKFFGS